MLTSLETSRDQQDRVPLGRLSVAKAASLRNSQRSPARCQLGLRHSNWDALLILLSVVLGSALLMAPSIWLVALTVWWGANTVAHNFIHLPFFRSRALNTLFSVYLSLLLGIPQRLWRDRHLAHHGERRWRLHVSNQLMVESTLVGLLWTGLILASPGFFWGTYLPGWLIGLGLCQLHGYFEHARGTTSHYGRLYNLLFFNDGYHIEHHARPQEHWTRLPLRPRANGHGSRWPACLRWLELFGLESLERIVLSSPRLQKFVLAQHERAFRQLLPHFEHARHVLVVGGGMFPRTALILRCLLPEARITILDCEVNHLSIAQRWLPDDVELAHGFFQGHYPDDVDLAVIPLAFQGDRESLYCTSTAQSRTLLVHEWLWRRHRPSVVISRVLMKRLVVVKL